MLNKDTIVRALAADHGLTLRKAGELYGQVIGSVAEALNSGTPVRLSGFGTLKIIDVAPRVVKNPRTGDPIQLGARKRVRFSAASRLKRSVNGL